MIGKLRGIVDSVGDDWVILDVGGVGYEISCSTRTLASIPAIGDTLSLSIETYVREDQIRLFGFIDDLERTWFRLLQSVQGVGAKVALAILSTHSANDLANAIALQDKAEIARAPGIGPKVAQRLVTELKEKVPVMHQIGITGVVDKGVVVGLPEGTAAADAVSALTNLGYPLSQASNAIALATKTIVGEPRAEELIKLGLRELSR
jgi:Holliday junction DNA helicase RuvA